MLKIGDTIRNNAHLLDVDWEFTLKSGIYKGVVTKVDVGSVFYNVFDYRGRFVMGAWLEFNSKVWDSSVVLSTKATAQTSQILN